MQIPFKLAANLWKALNEWNILGEKFLTIALSLKDIKLKLKSPMESFPSINLKSVAGCAYAWVKRPYNFKYVEPGFPQSMQNDPDLFGTRL